MAVAASGSVPVQARPATPPGGTEALIQLLEQGRCPGCDLAGADLVHAQLADADLSGSRLQRANLGQARLDGARLGGADLSFTSLMGASLRGADLRGARLEGTDLRQADLSGALLSPGALSRAHWQGARGIDQGQLSFGELHNAGVDAAGKGRYPEAEQWFSAAIRREPAAAVSWLARAITRSQQGKSEDAANDFTYAAGLYEAAGERDTATQLRQAAEQVKAAPDRPEGGGNGLGMAAIGGAVSGALGALQFLAPIAAKAFLPLPF
ncbi:pentapeptide repeat-containing protein [Cyanobium sp. CH-040]|uniref:pentapeptide repeat-containing protein n=1 Tax=Cyanobium sp. CH-040 TaxID=2823708 RepID=UPI0020CF7CEB|nr:pentapeptide repeat-containing protein [Cyanobium sp. CH-040]MCP9926660.1 pentapeptide repeat-containing protein [Cyanobium sp. CH-040]